MPNKFDALARLMRLRPGPAQDAARLVLVAGMSTPAASRAVGMSYPTAHQAVKRVKTGLELARKAANPM
jgi:hypothetical protein